ncbi:SufE family protein [Niabella drilacis]|uniref:Cysteine desulfuration protein SufE n=1 Tax=Niabella drilacis (strain DSM 25811 / CCM 8410 / CCUG 62505 / LMG 26954 / E90) TaxID=1285928 RepID=A0A1G6WSQ7_NIADE|nr:SufE family protein [Niabella drilacis]SDD68918.1 cysteine desulfuration protein SufE [Niabella drilacis]
MDINRMQDKIIAEFENLATAVNKFSYFRHLKKISNGSQPMDPEDKNDRNLVTGCSRKVWVTAYKEDGRIFFKADSEHSITRGLVNLLLKVYSGHTVSTITNTDLYFLHEIKLFNYLSASWMRDFLSVIQRIKSLAIVQHLDAAPRS